MDVVEEVLAQLEEELKHFKARVRILVEENKKLHKLIDELEQEREELLNRIYELEEQFVYNSIGSIW